MWINDFQINIQHLQFYLNTSSEIKKEKEVRESFLKSHFTIIH